MLMLLVLLKHGKQLGFTVRNFGTNSSIVERVVELVSIVLQKMCVKMCTVQEKNILSLCR